MRQVRFYLLCCLIGVTLSVASPVDAAPEPRARGQEQITHVVQPGQNLFRIALRYETTVDAIVAANGLSDSHTLYVGQRLVIPRAAGRPETESPFPSPDGAYVVQAGDTLSSIARRHGTSVSALTQANRLSDAHTLYAGQRLVIPSAGSSSGTPQAVTGESYVVQAGDSLSEIAERLGIPQGTLARLNGIANPSAIHPGQLLRLSDEVVGPQSAAPKRVVVDLSDQHLYAYEGNQLVYSFVASSGAAPSYTRTGEFHVQSKVPNAYGSAWNIWMPHWLGIYWAGSTENGIHALPILPNGQTLWAGYLGRPVSFGCIVLGTHEAQLLYDWATIGTPVSIRP